MRSHKQINNFHEISASQHGYRKPMKKIITNTSWLELGTHFLDSLVDHGTIESIKICPFKTFLEQCFDKEPSCPFFFSLLHVKNCVLYTDISVEFAFNSCVEISKFLFKFRKSGNTLSKLHRNTSLLGKVSRWNLLF